VMPGGVAAAADSGQQVSLTSQLAKTREELHTFMGASVAAQATAISWGASGSMTFSESQDINTFDLNYVVRVSVVTTGKTALDVRLKPEILDQLQREADPARWFLDTCGDSFVAKIVQGGDLLGSVAIQTTSRSNARSIEASVGGSYALFSGGAAVSQTIAGLRETNQVKVVMQRSGGVIDTGLSFDELLRTVKEYPLKVHDKPWPLRATTQSYAVVPDLPEVVRKSLNRKSADLDRLVLAYGQALGEVARIRYVSQHSAQFYLDPFDVPRLADDVNRLIEYGDGVKNRITTCLSSGTGCSDPLTPVPLSRVYPGRR
jgi:hypothetical protein